MYTFGVNKMTEITILPHSENYGELVFRILMSVALLGIAIHIQDADKYLFIVSAFYFLFVLMLCDTIKWAILALRKLKFTSEGCLVSFLFFSKMYNWNCFNTKHLNKKENSDFSLYDESIWFSVREPSYVSKVRRKYYTFSSYYSFNTIVVQFPHNRKTKISGRHQSEILFVTEKEPFMKALRSWNIDIDESYQ